MITSGGRTRASEHPVPYGDPNGTLHSTSTGQSYPPIPRGIALHDALVYAYSSTFHSKDKRMSITVRSPGVRPQSSGPHAGLNIPIFGLRDMIGGTITLAAPPGWGTLTVTMEGCLHYSSPTFSRRFQASLAHPLRHKHVFLSSTFVFLPNSTANSTVSTSVTGNSRVSSQKSRLGLSQSIKRMLSGRRSKNRSDPTPEIHRGNGHPAPAQLHFIERSFSFHIPYRADQEIPPSFYASVLNEGDGVRGRASVESAEVEYHISASWDAPNGIRNSVEAPFLFLPDPSHHAPKRPMQWSETPLVSSRPLPFKCALCLPHPRTFTREMQIPFSVTFTTDPLSRSLARDIAADAVITVTFVRNLSFDPSQGFRTSFSSAPPSSATTISTQDSLSRGRKPSLLQRVATSPIRLAPFGRSHGHGQSLSTSNVSSVPPLRPPPEPRRIDKALPAPPPEAATSESRVLHTVRCLGFPKRPRRPAAGVLFAPEGIWKGHLDLAGEALPTLGYGGASVKYFIIASVRFGGEDLKVSADVKIIEPHSWWERGEMVAHGGRQ